MRPLVILLRGKMLCKTRKSPKLGEQDSSPQETEEFSFPRRNWAIAILLQALISGTFCIILPSMHQLITNPTTDDKQANATVDRDSGVLFWPGLGLSESFYSWAVSMYSIGELITAPLAGYMTKYIPYRFTFLLSALLLAIGCFFYAMTLHGWMMLITRLLIGLHSGIGLVVVTTYLGETATEVAAKREAAGGKRDHSGATLKDKLFLWYSLIMQISYPLTMVISAIMTQISSVDPYRWAAWFTLAVTTLYIIMTIVAFKETRSFQVPKCSSKAEKEEKGRRSGQRLGWKDIFIYAFIIVCGYVAGALYTVMDTLLNPLLSDHFGFTIADTSYYILGITVLLVGGTGIQFILKKLRVDNRKVFMLSLILAIVGGFIMSDWQSIGNDPCSAINTPELVARELPPLDTSLLPTLSSEGQQSSDNSTTLQLREACEALSTPEDRCRWNPVSQFTGKYCQDCYPVCRSVRRSLNFFQFCLGVGLVTLSIPISTVVIVVIASDVVSLEMQGTIIGLVWMASGCGRVISPLWVDATYEAVGKHTYLTMTINSVLLGIALLAFAALYKQLAPRVYNVGSDGNIESATVIKLKGTFEKESKVKMKEVHV